MEINMKFLKKLIGITFATLLIISSLAYARTNQPNWHKWLKELRQEAIADGMNPNLFDKIFHNMKPNKRLLRLDRTQPETRLTYYKYRNTRGDAYRIKLGHREYKRHKKLLKQIGRQYGVDPCIIVAIWGLESSYGRYMGNFNVIRSLTTLAYDSRRSVFFRKELLLALRMVNEGHVDVENFKGEWAGASGQSQFLPSSWYKYAVDYDLDGRKDIWQTHGDIFASIANYLRSNNWQTNQPRKIEVILPSNFNSNLIGLTHTKTIQEWHHLGIQIKIGQQWPNKNLNASIIYPYGGPYFMVFNNFKTLLSWNYSTYYAGTVDYVARKICQQIN